MEYLKKQLYLSLLLLLILPLAMAQEPVFFDAPGYEYRLAIELLQKEKYGSAQQYFKYVYENTPDKQHDLKSNAYFYMGVCAAKLYHNDAVFLLKDFIRYYPVHAFVPEANYFIGNFYFYKKQYKRALDHYELIDEGQIKKNELAEFYFKKGYSYFEAKKLDEAKVYLLKARQQENGEYTRRAIYYIAYISYQEGQHQAALEDFMLLKDEQEYQETVPLYIAQIYFLQEKYEELLAMAPPLLEKLSKKNQPEMNRIIALSYYNLGMYEQSWPYFSNYAALTKGEVSREDYFAMGYTAYRLEDYSKAVSSLSKVTRVNDAMSQNSFYIIGDCYLNMKQYSLSMQSFLEASKSDHIPDVKEDALYNYAKLQYETSSSPFNSAIRALENYINEYPNSSRSEEASAYLSAIYMSTKNYQGAIQSLEKIANKTPDLLRAYQRCTHFRALELINSRRNEEAVALLKKSLIYPLNKELRLSSMYWKAEAEYRAGEYKDAFFDFKAYHETSQAKSDENYNFSFYSLGYSALKINKYTDAQKAFRTFVSLNENESDMSLLADAFARLGDSYYMQKDLKSAIYYYNECEKLNQDNADYALYQQARCYSYQKNETRKIEKIEQLIHYYPRSPYADDAEYELATSYHLSHNYTAAITAYENFIKKYPKSSYIRQVYNKMAQAYLNIQEEETAINMFKYVFETYPGSQEAKDALANLETIYTEQGNTSDFFDYIKKKNMNVSMAKQDSISFKAGENKYLRGDCESTVKSLADYIKQFPNGLFIAKAYFYKAECEYGLNRFSEALKDYEQIIKNYQTEYNETALRKASTILYNEKEYAKALAYFRKMMELTSSSANILYAQRGVMYTTYELKQYKDALSAAKAVLDNKDVDEDVRNEAKLIAGKSAMALKEYATANTFLGDLAKQSANDYAAEAAYLTCLMEFEQGNYDACEKKIIDMLAAQYNSGAEYWFASVFILYGDLYAVRENYFQARHTYQSIVDNYDGDDLKEVARQKIEEIDRMENKQEEEKESIIDEDTIQD